MKTRSSKPQIDEDPDTEGSISGSADQTQTLLHYTVHALSNTRREILKFFGNWIIIFIINYFMKFCCAFCSKSFTNLGIFKNILLSWDNKERMWIVRFQENSWELAALLSVQFPAVIIFSSIASWYYFSSSVFS